MSNPSGKCRIALANLPFPETPDESVFLAGQAIAQAGAQRADIICFPECFVPGYRAEDKCIAAPDIQFLGAAWDTIAQSAQKANVAVILGTERIVNGQLRATALVMGSDGSQLGFQDKVQIAPEEEGVYAPGAERRLFQSGSLVFGVVICHEGWRYPETVRWAVRRGATVVFHPHFHETEIINDVPPDFASVPGLLFEKIMQCRGAENTCYFVSVNCASAGASTSAVLSPDGTVLAHMPRGKAGVLIADLDLELATGLYAARCKYA